MTTDTLNTPNYFVMDVPKYSEWSARVAGVNYTPLKGQEPNAFHRLMQRLVLGIEWERRSNA